MEPLDELAGYRVHSRIASGAWGEVYRASQSSLGRMVALKVLRDVHHSQDPTARQRFLREARIQVQLKHPNLVQCLDYGCESSLRYIVLELVEGTDLRRWWQTLEERTPETLQAVWLDLATVLAYLHRQGVVHRDVKPENVLVGADGVVKLGDLGLAHGDQETLLTKPGEIFGTLPYMAPEIFGTDPFHPALDIYGLGAVIHELWCGSYPVERIELERYAEQVARRPPATGDPRFAALPLPLRRLLDAQLQPEPGNRPSADELVRALGGGATPPAEGTDREGPVTMVTPRRGVSGPVVTGDRARESVSRMRIRPFLAMLLVLVFMAGGAVGALLRTVTLPPEPAPRTEPSSAPPSLPSPATAPQVERPAADAAPSTLTRVLSLYGGAPATSLSKLWLELARREGGDVPPDSMVAVFLLTAPREMEEISIALRDVRPWSEKSTLELPSRVRLNRRSAELTGRREARVSEYGLAPEDCRPGINLVLFPGAASLSGVLEATLHCRRKPTYVMEVSSRRPVSISPDELKIVDSFMFHLEMSNLVTAGQIVTDAERAHPDRPIGSWTRGYLCLRLAHHERFFSRPGIEFAGQISTITGIMADERITRDPVAMAAEGLDTLQQTFLPWPDLWLTWASMGSGLYVCGAEDLGMQAMEHARSLGKGHFLPLYIMAVSLEFSWLAQDSGEAVLRRTVQVLDEAGREASALGRADYRKWVQDAQRRVQRHLIRYR